MAPTMPGTALTRAGQLSSFTANAWTTSSTTTTTAGSRAYLTVSQSINQVFNAETLHTYGSVLQNKTHKYPP